LNPLEELDNWKAGFFHRKKGRSLIGSICNRLQMHNKAFAAVSLLVLFFIILIYSNSFDGSWQYDDSTNILGNRNIHLKSLSISALKDSFFRTNPLGDNRIQRPLAYLSFALNYYWGGLNPWGYHLFNLCIHLCASVLLYLFIVEMLQTPRLFGRYGENARWIALAATSMWAAHPIQVTAVTYIVQRMAAMAAMFAMLSMYMFLKARRSPGHGRQYLFYSVSFLAYLAGLASKENVISIPLCMLILDVWIIRDCGQLSMKKAAVTICFVFMVIGLLAGTIASLGDFTLMGAFPNRLFSPFQRLLTQPRVILAYLVWIFVPMRSHLTLLHDIDFSVNMLDPVTTLPSIIIVLGGTIGLFVLFKRYPMPVFCGLFFIINHLVEASFLNLELIYEHRNYLPSMLLFVPLSAWLIGVAQNKKIRQWIRCSCIIAMGLFVVSNGHSVFAYNHVFRSELLLWLDVTEKSPRLSLAYNNLGKVYWNMGLFEEAHRQFEHAYHIDRYNDRIQKGAVYHNLGLYQAYVAKNDEKALSFFESASEIMNGYPATWYHRARANFFLGDSARADAILAKALIIWPNNERLMMARSVMNLAGGKLSDAMASAQKVRAIASDKPQILVLISEIQRRMGDLEASSACYEAYLKVRPEDEKMLKTMKCIRYAPCQTKEYVLELFSLLGIEDVQ
jgi:tetratricopeptide (TPR) repeat protein